MNIDRDAQAIPRFCVRKLKASNNDITDGMGLIGEQ
jgi:hypothetical protein